MSFSSSSDSVASSLSSAASAAAASLDAISLSDGVDGGECITFSPTSSFCVGSTVLVALALIPGLLLMLVGRRFVRVAVCAAAAVLVGATAWSLAPLAIAHCASSATSLLASPGAQLAVRGGVTALAALVGVVLAGVFARTGLFALGALAGGQLATLLLAVVRAHVALVDVTIQVAPFHWPVYVAVGGGALVGGILLVALGEKLLLGVTALAGSYIVAAVVDYFVDPAKSLMPNTFATTLGNSIDSPLTLVDNMSWIGAACAVGWILLFVLSVAFQIKTSSSKPRVRKSASSSDVMAGVRLLDDMEGASDASLSGRYIDTAYTPTRK